MSDYYQYDEYNEYQYDEYNEYQYDEEIYYDSDEDINNIDNIDNIDNNIDINIDYIEEKKLIIIDNIKFKYNLPNLSQFF
tara:strand:- start:1512 stop:1751 length:240 start_codon:yes stop_codon:yes gene_type:complete